MPPPKRHRPELVKDLLGGAPGRVGMATLTLEPQKVTEAGCIPVSAVIASAISDAEGFAITSMPISPVELWELRQRHAAGGLPSLRAHAPHPSDPFDARDSTRKS